MRQPEERESLVHRRPATIIVPAYQEESDIGHTILELDRLCRRLDAWQWEIIVVDDGSTDYTCREAALAATEIGTEVRVLRHAINKGLGSSLRTGIVASRGDVVLTADCDLSYSIDTLEQLVHEFTSTKAKIVIASPYMPGGSTVSVPRPLEFRSRAANHWLRAMCLGGIYTLTGLARAYDGPLIRSMSLKATDGDINVEIIYKAQALRAHIVEIPATLNWGHLPERGQRSSLITRRARLVTYKQLVNGYLWRPFWFPLAAAIILSIPGCFLLVTGKLGWQGLAVVCAVGSLLLLFFSLASLQAKRYFEELYTLGTGLRAVVGAPPLAASSTAVEQHEAVSRHEVVEEHQDIRVSERQ
jgi:glycosyltransferase involved in cell wall biosynthesis